MSARGLWRMTFSREPDLSKPDRHGWNALDHYLTIHDQHLDRRRYFIESHSLVFAFVGDNVLTFLGRIDCAYGLFIDVDKTLEMNEHGQVRTVKYSYHAGLSGGDDRPVFRYDNAQVYEREGHADAHHRHRYDHTTWNEIRPRSGLGTTTGQPLAK